MTTTTFDIADHKLFDGKTYMTSHETDLAQDGTMSILMENPSDSGKEVILFYGDITHEGETDFTMTTNVDSISGGSDGPAHNNTIGSSNSSVVNITIDPSFSNGTEHHKVVYTGSDHRQIFGGYKTILKPGNNVVFELLNPSSNNDQASILITWAEKPT